MVVPGDSVVPRLKENLARLETAKRTLVNSTFPLSEVTRNCLKYPFTATVVTCEMGNERKGFTYKVHAVEYTRSLDGIKHLNPVSLDAESVSA